MKISGIITFLAISMLFTTQCKRVDCVRYSRGLSEAEKQLTPYQLNETVYFTDQTDTFSMQCLFNEYTQEVDIDADHYYYEKCDGGRETYYWELATKYTTDINYTDSSLLMIEINTNTNYSFEEGVFTLILYDSSWSDFYETYSFFTRANNSEQLFKARISNPVLPPAYNQCELTYYNELQIDGFLYKHVNLLYGNIINFDSIYYNNKFGIIRMVQDSTSYNIIR
jgi:hypothetical protein